MNKIGCYVPETVIAGCEEIIAECDDAILISQRMKATALINMGDALADLDQLEEAMDAWYEVNLEYGDSSDLELRILAIKALSKIGVTLYQLDQWDSAADMWGKVVAEFGNDTQPELRVLAGHALFNKGVALRQLDRYEKAMDAWDEVDTKFGDASDPGLTNLVARALFNKGKVLAQLGQWERAIKVFEEVYNRYGDAIEQKLYEKSVKVLVSEGLELAEREPPEKAIDMYDRMFGICSGVTEPDLQLYELAAKSLFNKANILDELGQWGAAVGVYDELVDQFGRIKGAKMNKLVATARDCKKIAQERLWYENTQEQPEQCE